jgi:ubiquinone/menaquinone biosynthesis C-methylase UbiE
MTLPEVEWGRLVSERYSAEAREYRDLWAPLLLPHGEELLEALPLRTADRVLDVGSGSGTLIPGIVRRAPSAVAVGIDRAPGMLALAPPPARRAVMDAGRLGLATAAFDVAVLAFLLFHTVDPRHVLAEVRRALKRGGAAGATTWAGDPDFPAQRVWLDELNAHGAVAEETSITSHAPVGTPDRVRRLFEATGFAAVRTWTRPFGHTYGVEEFIALRTRHGWSARRFARLAPTDQEALLHRARRRLQAMPARELFDDTEVIFAIAEAI